MAPMPIEVRPITGALGAEIHGVDLGARPRRGERRRRSGRPCSTTASSSSATSARRRRSRRRLARRFGDIFVHPNYAGTRADPEIIEIRREPGDKRIVGEDWHTDTTMMPEPPMGAILYAIEVPPYGGDTLFANQYLAYEALSDGMKRLLSGLRRRPQRPQGGRARRPG